MRTPLQTAHHPGDGTGSSYGQVRTLGLCLAVALVGALASSTAAGAETPGPGWALSSQTYPTNLPPAKAPGEVGGVVEVRVLNVGAAPSNGPVTITDTLPPGLIATDAGELGTPGFGPEGIGHRLWDCGGIGTSVITCTNDPVNMPHVAGGGGAPNVEAEHPEPALGIAVQVNGSPGVVRNGVTIAGGGAQTSASTEAPITISPTPAAPAVTGFDTWLSNADGTLDTQAGSHPYEATFSLDLATERTSRILGEYPPARGAEVRNIEATLPRGFVGNPNAVPQCTHAQLVQEACPLTSQVGILQVYITGGVSFRAIVFNMPPPAGSPAEFGAFVEGVVTLFDATVRTGGDYGITTNIDNIVRKNLTGSVLTLWGVPADPSHDPYRTGAERGCREQNGQIVPEIGGLCIPSTAPLKPFLTLPTSCDGAQPFGIRTNTWQEPDSFFGASVQSHDADGVATGFNGCEALGFAPAITTAPDASAADTPTGLTVEVRPPIGGLEDPEGTGTANIQNTTVTLPEGLVINPGQAAGLQACQAQESAVGTESAPSCPLASKVGTVKIKSPLIEAAAEKEFEGDVYVLQSNPPELKLLVAASADGVNLKLVGVVHLNEQTGQLTTKFDGTPELPFTVFKLSFSGGAQAALDTPALCGTYTTTSDFTPWSSPFVADVFPSSAFGVTAGPGGGPCPSSPLPFSPVLTAGSTTDQAGGFTSFSLLLQRGDGQQRIERLQFREPAGLAGMISSVPLCPEPQASQGQCPDASKIGHAAVASGPGPYPLTIPQPGNPESPIFLTGPYEGAPFGLSIVTHVIAGPFDLGTIITRAKIEIDPHTAQITVTTDPFPQIVDGVPTDLRLIDSVIDRPNFLFNPTSCTPQEFAGTAWGTPPPGAGGPGATAAISTRFGVGSCRELAFAPKFAVSTPGRTSRANGAGLTAKLAYPKAAQGTQADIASVKVSLPKQLPSRLTTLQKACTAVQFELNPAGCPGASKVGMAIVHTQLLPVPLMGPAIFVSHGNEAFPSLTIVLQGDNVTVDLVGSTFISKQGITSTTFKTVPDVPFENFELTLPQGPYSALAANGSLCTSKLVMPTDFVAQNGTTKHQSTSIAITGCTKKKTLTRTQKLTAALKACHKDRNKNKRTACEHQAHTKYRTAKKKR